ncbi:Fimbrial associated sortase family protein [Candidatus Roizmanbacteria bacterium]|mgnify:FL=1|nr:Fimbrial associated sortase family protein [Candidatus Roizmanbacteria bacterium]
MALHVYLKKKHYYGKKRTVNVFSYIFLIAGAFLFFWSFYPILSSEIYSQLFIQNNINTPVTKQTKAAVLNEANSILGAFNIFSNNLRDYTQASIWFPASPQSSQMSQLTVKEYTLSIPKLNIKKARVVVGGEDLTKSLVHYLPKTLPGEYGNVAIFGHSTLPQLYNTKDYKTIFTYLSALEKGDKVYVNIGELEYQYEVTGSIIVMPSDISVLEQKKDASYITLITCTPLGTYLKRLVVTAKLTKI